MRAMQATCTHASNAQTLHHTAARSQFSRCTRHTRAHRIHKLCTAPQRETNFRHARAHRMHKYCTVPQREANFRDARAHRMHQYCTGPQREANVQHARATRVRIISTNFAPRRSERPILHRTRARARMTRARAHQMHKMLHRAAARDQLCQNSRAQTRAHQNNWTHVFARQEANPGAPAAQSGTLCRTPYLL